MLLFSLSEFLESHVVSTIMCRITKNMKNLKKKSRQNAKKRVRGNHTSRMLKLLIFTRNRNEKTQIYKRYNIYKCNNNSIEREEKSNTNEEHNDGIT